jgi:hypothetical protein
MVDRAAVVRAVLSLLFRADPAIPVTVPLGTALALRLPSRWLASTGGPPRPRGRPGGGRGPTGARPSGDDLATR